ncbi:MAG: HEAT repeat domain-containing protein [Myxococcales bacterium]|nr:HEAT repeat domain-containing protein [Myxococcales bacterium]
MSQNTPLRVLHQRARAAMQSGNLPEAMGILQEAASRTSARESEYTPVLADLRTVLVQLGRHRAALTVDWYRADGSGEQRLLDSVPPMDKARTLQAWAERAEGNQSIDFYARAAKTYESAGLVAQAAICREKARDYAAARTLWSRLGDALSRAGGDRYAAGLARFNLSRCAKEMGDAPGARAAVVQSVHLLEEAADRYERIGQRERAFDCYQVLIAIGKQSGDFEHVLEGYVNVVRILREDNLRYYAIQSYEDALGDAEKNEEFAAGATLAQEMASYALGENMLRVANYASRLQANMWQRVASATVQRGGPTEMAENAILAAIVALARQGQFDAVGRMYAALADLDLEPSRKAHYARACTRYHGVKDAVVDAAPLAPHLRQDAAFPDVWHVDLVEWEQQGSASQACGDVVLEPESWSEVTRRRAMLARLQALEVEAQSSPDPGALVKLTELLGHVELYQILAPLERLYESPLPQLRLAVITALERFMYKRTFVTVRAALSDSDAEVRRRACSTVEALRFPHAFDPLARIFRESSDPGARTASLRAIARIDTREAAELLLGVFQHEGKAERTAAAEALKRARGGTFLEVARSEAGTLDDRVRQDLREVFQARGEML